MTNYEKIFFSAGATKNFFIQPQNCRKSSCMKNFFALKGFLGSTYFWTQILRNQVGVLAFLGLFLPVGYKQSFLGQN
jgi:hypothetical protein